VDLRVVPAESFGAALLYFTGSKAHNIELRRIAIDRGLLLNEYGLFRGEERLAGRTEQEVYRALGLDWVPPEMRESLGEVELAAEGRLPRLVELEDIRGDLHMHTDRTDGKESLASMVRAAREHGYEYCAITDHSKALAMTGGFDAARVRQSVDEIAAVRREVPGIEVLHGLEVDILADGSLDLDDESLALLDWVIVSLHSNLTQDRAVMTERVLKALSHPAVHMMGHPMARRVSSRPPVPMDMERVLDRAAERGVAMEINAQPDRLDLDDVNARAARERGIPLVIDTDAHNFTQMDFLAYGVFMARRAWCRPEDILNTRDLAGLRQWLPRRGSPAPAHPAKPPIPKASARKSTPVRRKAAPRPGPRRSK
jgi:DNA polymerase (family 10)